jgi:hypothetical protein
MSNIHHQILAREVRTAIGGRKPILVRFHKDETIHVFVGHTGASTHYVMEIGSDDDDFHFYDAKDPAKKFVLRFPMPDDWLRLLFKDTGMSEAEVEEGIKESHKTDELFGYTHCFGPEQCAALVKRIEKVLGETK